MTLTERLADHRACFSLSSKTAEVAARALQLSAIRAFCEEVQDRVEPSMGNTLYDAAINSLRKELGIE